LKKGVFDPSCELRDPDQDTREKLNMEYARDYKIFNDFSIFWRSVFNPPASD
jgi:hypothetical protein